MAADGDDAPLLEEPAADATPLPDDVPTGPLDPTPAGPELDRLTLPRRPGREYDHLGRLQPFRLGFVDFIDAIPGASERVRRVPKSHIEEDTDDEIMLRCPCGAQPAVPYREATKCAGDCGRWYYAIHRGSPAFVIYGGMEPPTPGLPSP